MNTTPNINSMLTQNTQNNTAQTNTKHVIQKSAERDVSASNQAHLSTLTSSQANIQRTRATSTFQATRLVASDVSNQRKDTMNNTLVEKNNRAPDGDDAGKSDQVFNGGSGKPDDDPHSSSKKPAEVREKQNKDATDTAANSAALTSEARQNALLNQLTKLHDAQTTRNNKQADAMNQL